MSLFVYFSFVSMDNPDKVRWNKDDFFLFMVIRESKGLVMRVITD